MLTPRRRLAVRLEVAVGSGVGVGGTGVSVGSGVKVGGTDVSVGTGRGVFVSGAAVVSGVQAVRRRMSRRSRFMIMQSAF
jgi:hypothetical protein